MLRHKFKYIDMKNFNIGDAKRKYPYPIQVIFKEDFKETIYCLRHNPLILHSLR